MPIEDVIYNGKFAVRVKYMGLKELNRGIKPIDNYSMIN